MSNRDKKNRGLIRILLHLQKLKDTFDGNNDIICRIRLS